MIRTYLLDQQKLCLARMLGPVCVCVGGGGGICVVNTCSIVINLSYGKDHQI